jgi:hypothetical protein
MPAHFLSPYLILPLLLAIENQEIVVPKFHLPSVSLPSVSQSFMSIFVQLLVKHTLLQQACFVYFSLWTRWHLLIFSQYCFPRTVMYVVGGIFLPLTASIYYTTSGPIFTKNSDYPANSILTRQPRCVYTIRQSREIACRDDLPGRPARIKSR